MNAIIPIPRCPVSVRPATTADYPFIDRLQDMHSKALGFMPKAQLQGKIDAGHVLVAEDEMRLPIGYCMSQDRYFKRDDLGIIYQMSIAPAAQRKLVGATLLRAVFERAAYGCRLFCCWCAQDLEANHFWESLGFVPLAFRAGAGGKRVHIFWQRRIRQGDATTPYWFPAKTDGGMMREDRLVLPIPPGVHWKDPMPILLPEVQNAPAPRSCLETQKKKGGSVPQLMPPTRRRARFGPPSANDVPDQVVAVAPKPEKKKRDKVKADPRLIAAARELRDRWLERVNAAGGGAILESCGKYNVSSALPAAGAAARESKQALLLLDAEAVAA